VEGPSDVDRIDDREPCPDDLCTGIIGEDGRCGVCGRRREGGPPGEGPYDDPEKAEAGEAEAGEAEVEIFAAESGDEGDEEERVPCPDDLCTGIIGEDGRCGVCGRAKG
jgi:hypothetical protein